MRKSSSIIPTDGATKSREIKKIETELLEKYRAELRSASSRKTFILKLKIVREAHRIFRHRLYSSTTGLASQSR